MTARSDWTASREDIVACFQLLLGRDPNPVEVGHFDRVGDALDAVVGAFVRSREFALRGLLNAAQQAAVEVVQCHGFEILVAPDDADVGRHVRGGAYEPNVTAAFQRFLRPGMSVLDIGANIGFFSMLAASLVGPGGRVLAVEPNPANVKMIEASRRLNRFQQLSVLQTAAGRGTGVLALNVTSSNGSTATLPDDVGAVLGSSTVMVLPLDLLVPVEQRVDFIKIDVEGGEAAALEGLQGVIRRDHPVIVSEFSPEQMLGYSQGSGPDYLRFLVGHGYRLSVLHVDQRVEPAGTDVDVVMQAYRAAGVDHIDILAE